MVQGFSPLGASDSVQSSLFYETKPSKGTELFDLSELSASQQDQLWTRSQLGSGGCSSQLLRAAYIAQRANAQDCNPLHYSKQHQKSFGSLPATMKNVEGNIWDRDKERANVCRKNGGEGKRARQSG